MRKTFKKSLSWLLSVVMIFGIVSAVPVIADATQTSSSFNQSYSLTGNSANDIVTVANAQMEKSGSSLGYSEQWCADFVCDCARYAGISDSVIPYNYSARGACTYLYNQMIDKCGATPVSSAQAGDFIFWSNDSNNNNFGHVGIVVNSTNAISGNNGVNGDYNIYHTIVKNYKFSQSGYSNWVIVRPNYSNNPVPPTPNDWESMPVDEKYYFKNNGTGTYMSIDYGEDTQGKNISVYQKTGDTGQQFEIRSAGDKTYYLRPVLCESSGRVVNVYSESSYNGANVTIYNFTGHSTQQWKFRKVNGGYAICSANNTSTCLAESGTNVQLATYTGASNQIWTLEPIHIHNYTEYVYNSSAHPHYKCYRCSCGDVQENRNEPTFSDTCSECLWSVAPAAPVVKVIPGTSTTPTKISWNSVSNAKCYDLRVWSTGDDIWELTSTSYEIILPPGTHSLGVCSRNDVGYNYCKAVEFTVTVDYNANPVVTKSFNGHKYEYYSQKMDWNTAYKFCEKKGGHLVTITSQEENDFILELAKNRSDNLWAGGRTFDAQTWFWITGESFNYNNWDVDEPNNMNGTQDAMQIYVSGKWDDVASSDNKVFVCEYDNIDASKYAPAYKENYNGHEYWFFEDGVDWQTAKKVCEAKGGYLAIPNNADENAFILSGIQKTSKDEAWIGITDIAKESVWKNVKGGSITYSNWANDEPSNYLGIEDYVEMCPSGKWNDLRGFGANYRSVGFVCEFDDLQTVTSDPNAPSIVVGQKTAAPGQTVTVDISIKNNPGITGFKINVSYNKNVLTLQNAETIGFDAMYSQNMTAMPFVVSWENGLQDVKLDGEIIRLTFAVNGNAADGSYPVTVSYQPDDIYNLKEENIHFAVINGSVEVQKHIPGDINNDGKVNMKDVTRLHQYINGWNVTVVESAIDVNGDGKVNMKDLTRLHQYINGWDVVIY